jgi:hypothetical protein
LEKSQLNLSPKRAYFVAVFSAEAACVLSPALERSYELEAVAETAAIVSLGMSVTAICLAIAWLRRATVPELRQAALITLAVPFIGGFIEFLFSIQGNVHGVGMATFLFGGMLSLLAVLILIIGATVKHIRAVN